MFGLNSRFDASGKKLFQAFMLEAYDHKAKYNSAGRTLASIAQEIELDQSGS
jgi:hypothetical protein